MPLSRPLEQLVASWTRALIIPSPCTWQADWKITKVYKRHGLYRLLEELVPFMDHSIDDPAAIRMSGGHHKRKQSSHKVRYQYADSLVLSVHKFLPCVRPCPALA
jgi:hypothetical protein